MAHRIYPHGACQELAPNLWRLPGTLSIPVPRNMTVYRTANGDLVLYSVIALEEEGMRALESLGRPAAMVVPHRRHHMDLPFYKARYPSIRVFGPRIEVVNGVQVDSLIPALSELGIRAGIIPGTDYDDVAMELPLANGDVALCVTETLGNVHLDGVLGFLLKMLGPPGGGFGVARAVRWREVTDKKALRQWLEKLAARTDIRMVLVGHGDPITVEAAAALRQAAAQV